MTRRRGGARRRRRQYTYAIECDPNNHVYFTNRAACYATMEEWEKCLRDAARAVEKKPDWVKVRAPLSRRAARRRVPIFA